MQECHKAIHNIHGINFVKIRGKSHSKLLGFFYKFIFRSGYKPVYKLN